jgi:arsenate reductase (glutaredoxin)
MNVITVYGIPHCDTVKRARQWLAGHAQAYQFHDFAKAGVPEDSLQAWVGVLGWEALLNCKGTTWRKLPDATRAAVLDATSAMAVMRLHASSIKRPVVRWSDGGFSVGFDEVDWLARL